MGTEQKERYYKVIRAVWDNYLKVFSDREHTDEFWEENYKVFNDIVNSADDSYKKLLQDVLEIFREDMNGVKR